MQVAMAGEQYLTHPAEVAFLASSSGIDASSAHSLIKVSWTPSPQIMPPATYSQKLH